MTVLEQPRVDPVDPTVDPAVELERTIMHDPLLRHAVAVIAESLGGSNRQARALDLVERLFGAAAHLPSRVAPPRPGQPSLLLDEPRRGEPDAVPSRPTTPRATEQDIPWWDWG